MCRLIATSVENRNPYLSVTKVSLGEGPTSADRSTGRSLSDGDSLLQILEHLKAADFSVKFC